MISGKTDLHMHSLSSDGVYSPSELVKKAAEAGITLMALTDHDDVSGLDEAQIEADKQGIRFIPGTEISTGPNGRTHLLVYGKSAVTNLKLTECLLFFRKDREDRFLRMCELVKQKLHVEVDGEKLIRENMGSIGRPHMADELVRLNIVHDRDEAFRKYIGDHGPCYVPHPEFSTARAIRLAKECGGIPVLAHPGLIKDRKRLFQVLPEWLNAGLMGLEVYYPAHKKEHYEPWLSISREHGLLVTGGSDFHAPGDQDEDHGLLGCTSTEWTCMKEDTDRLLEKLEK